MTQKLRGLSFYFPKTTNIAKTSSVKAFIADNETPTSPLLVFSTTPFQTEP
ncbi:hypothetical protein PROVRETT_08204 [Providencia rettgeri DSM 1131]|nr:hypothetical protein PROVRETT_08204 [Providencia rettgeri DSM 1131]